jgi:hypothetical protein
LLAEEMGRPVSSEPVAPPPAADVITRADSPPWLRGIALVSASGVLTFGLVGLFLADNSWYTPALAFLIGGVLLVGVCWLAWGAVRGGDTSRRAHVYAAIGLIAIVGITGWNARHGSEHLRINRDGGAYTEEGRWIARTGTLKVDPPPAPFRNQGGLTSSSYAVDLQKDGSLQFQSAHLLPVVLAESYAIGGSRLFFHLTELLGGIALLSFFVLAWRLIRNPFFALMATLTLAFIIPQVSFSRDTYSEIPSQILLFTAMWLLANRRVLPHWRLALTAGLFLGALEAVRIDGFVFLLGVPVVCGILWLRAARGEERRSALLTIGALLLGIVPGVVIGTIDLSQHSTAYWSHLWPKTHTLAKSCIEISILMIIVVAVWRFVVPLLRRLPWKMIATTVAVLVILLGIGAWAFRPSLETTHVARQGIVASLQRQEGAAVDATRSYAEHSLTWMAWYLGGATLLLAIVGAGLLLRELILGRMMRALAPLMILAPGALLYLWRPSAVPDQIWVTRRFLVSAFPVLILLALGFLGWVASTRRPGSLHSAIRIGAAALAVAAVLFPLYTLHNISNMSEERGYLGVMEDACHDIGPHAAVVVLQRDGGDLFDNVWPQAFRSWCGADVEAMLAPDPAVLQNLAAEFNAQGRKLFVAAADDQVIRGVFPNANVQTTRVANNPDFLEMTLTRRPSKLRTEEFGMAVAQVPLGLAG